MRGTITTLKARIVRQGKLFLLYCSVLSLGGNVNTRRMSKPEMGSIFHIKNRWNILVIGNFHVNYQNYQNLMLLTSSDTKRTLMHLFLFTNSAQRDLVSICMQSVHNKLSLPYILAWYWVYFIHLLYFFKQSTYLLIFTVNDN